MAEGKWIADLRPETPLADAARHVLTVRLAVVRDHLPSAVRPAGGDVEPVHQLRVATRRAGAALTIFAGCLPDKALRAAKKQLRRVRRSAAAARDWDVFRLALDAWAERNGRAANRQPALDFLSGYVFAQRSAAQVHLEEVCTDHPFAFDRFLAETVAAVHKPAECGQKRLIDLARPMLTELMAELEEAATADLDDFDHLHRVRILGKRLRYAMEVFADCFAAPFKEELYPQIEEMQDILGRANDSHVAGGRLAGLREQLKVQRTADWKRFRPGIDALIRHHARRLPAERKNFVRWWQRWHQSGTEATLAALLHPAVPAEGQAVEATE